MPDQPGNYVAELIDSFQTNEPVTAADVSADGNIVVLLTYFSLWIFKNFPGNEVFRGEVYRFSLKGFSQKEAVCFVTDHVLFIRDERQLLKGGKIYEVDLNTLDFTRISKQYKSPFFKRAVYNLFNNPEAMYRKIIRKEAAQ